MKDPCHIVAGKEARTGETKEILFVLCQATAMWPDESNSRI
jgi:hypothetical protein